MSKGLEYKQVIVDEYVRLKKPTADKDKKMIDLFVKAMRERGSLTIK